MKGEGWMLGEQQDKSLSDRAGAAKNTYEGATVNVSS
jgi:hypothetical protein